MIDRTMLSVIGSRSEAMTERRLPGRPRGDGIDDERELAAMADMLLANPTMRPTTAYKRIVRRPEQSAIRRIQAKWRDRRETFLTAATERRAQAQARTAARTVSSGSSGSSSMRLATEAAARRIDGFVAGLAFGRDVQTELSALATLRDAVDPPAVRRLRELTQNPLANAMRAMDGHPSLRAMRAGQAMMDTPTMRAARGLEDTTVSRALRAQEKIMRDFLGVR